MDGTGSMPNIYAYSNYRKYLEDYRIARKKVDARFTHSYICAKLGQENARSLFNNIVKGRKSLTTVFINRFIDLLNLDEEESRFFRILVGFNQSDNIKEKEYYFDQLIQLNNTPKKRIDKFAYQYYSEWWHSALRALLEIVNIRDEYKKLGQLLIPEINAIFVKNSINLLKQLGLIHFNEEGYWKPTEKAITTGEKNKDSLIKKYQIENLNLSKLAMLNADQIKPQKLSTLTFSISEKGYNRIKSRIQQLRKEIGAIVHKDEDEANRVYHLNMHMFPQSKEL